MFSVLLAIGLSGSAHTPLHPADADLYFDVPDLGAAIAAYTHAPSVEITSSPGAGHIADAARDAGFDLRALTTSLLPVPDPTRPGDAWWPWSAARRASCSLLGLEANSPPEARAAWFVCDFANAEAAAQAERALIAMGGGEPKPAGEWTIGESKVPVLAIRSPLELFASTAWCANTGTRLVVGMGAANSDTFVARLEAVGESVAPAWSALKLPVRSEDARGVIVLELGSDMDDLPAFAAGNPAFAGAVLALAPFACAMGHWRIELRDGRFVTDAVYEPRGTAKRLFDVLGSKPVSAAAMRLVPPDAVGAWVGDADPDRAESVIGGLLESWIGTPGSGTESVPGPRMSEGLKSALAVSLLPIQSLVSPAPRVVVAVELADAAKFGAGLDAWLARAQAANADLEIERKPYRKVATVALGLKKDPNESQGGGGLPFGASALEPTRITIAVLEDRVILASTPSAARNEIKRLQEKSDAPVNALVRNVVHPTDAFEISTMDWSSFLSTIYDSARGLLPAFAQGREKPIELDSLPTGAQLFAPLRPSTSWSKRVDGRILVHSESSFGPETPLALASVGYLAMNAMRAPAKLAPEPAAEETGPVAVPAEAAAESEAARTLVALREVRTALGVYRTQFGRVPATIAELLQKTDMFPDGFLKSGAVPKDGWGRELVLLTSKEGVAYELYSLGADGIDQHGAGDDVRLP